MQYDGRTIEYSTTFIDHLEIKGIRETNGSVVSARELANWPEHRIANDKGLMALFASNKKWKQIKLWMECYKVKLEIVDRTQPTYQGSNNQAELLHWVETANLIGHGFGMMSGGVWASMVDISLHDALGMIYGGAQSQLHVKIRVGSLEMYQPFTHVAAQCPRREHEPVREEIITTTAGEVIGALLGAGLTAWMGRNKH
ncbi:hypothetical protein D3C87_1382550 [compost metagenome]